MQLLNRITIWGKGLLWFDKNLKALYEFMRIISTNVCEFQWSLSLKQLFAGFFRRIFYFGTGISQDSYQNSKQDDTNNKKHKDYIKSHMFLSFFVKLKLIAQQEITPITPNIMANILVESTPEIIGVNTVTAKYTCLALSKIFDNRANSSKVKTGFLANKYFLISSHLTITKIFLSICLFVYLIIGLFVHSAYAATGINQTVNFQGKLVNSDGTNVTDGSYSIVFSLYTVSSGGSNIWTETDSVTTTNGVFRVALGSNTALSGVNFNQDTLWLGIKVGSDAEMTPRVQFNSVPYAFNAQYLDGLVATQSASGFTLTGGSSTTKTLTVSNSITLAGIDGKTLTVNKNLTLDGADSKTFTINNSLTFNGTDGNSFTFPNATGSTVCVSGQTCASSGTVGYLQRTTSGGFTYLAPSTATDVLSIGAATGLTGSGLSVKVNSLGNAAAYVENTGTGDIFTASGAGATKFVIDKNGNVGVGTATPNGRLDLTYSDSTANGTAGLKFTNSAAGGANWYWRVGATGTNTPAGGLSLANDTNYFLTITSAGKIGIGPFNTTPLAALDVQVNSLTQPIASFSGKTTFAGLVVDNSGKGDLFTASSSGLNRFVIAQNGNVGIGTTSPVDKLNVLGNITIGAQPNASDSAYTSLNSAAGTFGSQTTVPAATSSAIFRGKLFVATGNTASGGSAGVYRYDGGTTWTLVTHAAGQAVAGDTANSISGYSMTVYDNKLFIGSQSTQGKGKAAVYYSSTADGTADSFTLASNSQGTIASGGTAAIDSIDSMAVYNGTLYILTGKVGAAEVYRYNGGTGATAFTVVTQTAGEPTNNATDLVSGGILQVFDGSLYLGSKTGGGNNAAVYIYNGKNAATNPFTLINSTRGKFATTTNMQDITAITVFNGSLYVAATKGPGTAEVYRFYQQSSINTGINVPFAQLNTTPGELDPSVDTVANIRAITSMMAYNGQLYVGSDTAQGGKAAIYEYDPASVNSFFVTQLGSNKGVYGSDTAISAIDTMVPFNGALYFGTDQANKASVYIWHNTQGNSYALRFDPGFANPNYGSISFIASSEAATNQSSNGTFLFSNSISLASGGFDYAENYPTNDPSIEAGDIVAIDTNTPEYVKKAVSGDSLVGIMSTNPGFDLQQTQDQSNYANYIPIALSGRVPVKVSIENGNIQSGDLLTISSTPGVAMKAIKPGFIIGRAMESYSSNGVGSIMIFVTNTWADPSVQLTDKGDLNIADALPGSFGLPAAITDQAVLVGKSIASPSASSIAGLDMVKDQVAQLSSSVSTLSAAMNVLSAQSSVTASFSGNLVEVNGLIVDTTATVSGDLRVKGNSLFEGILSVIDTLKANNFIATGIAEFFDNVIFHQDVTFEGRPTFNSDTGGYAVVKKGSDYVDIVFTKEYEQTPIANASLISTDVSLTPPPDVDHHILSAGYTYIITNRSTKGFTILLNKPANDDIQFSWSALAVKDAKTFQSSGVSLPTPVASGSAVVGE